MVLGGLKPKIGLVRIFEGGIRARGELTAFIDLEEQTVLSFIFWKFAAVRRSLRQFWGLNRYFIAFLPQQFFFQILQLFMPLVQTPRAAFSCSRDSIFNKPPFRKIGSLFKLQPDNIFLYDFQLILQNLLNFFLGSIFTL